MKTEECIHKKSGDTVSDCFVNKNRLTGDSRPKRACSKMHRTSVSSAAVKMAPVGDKGDGYCNERDAAAEPDAARGDGGEEVLRPQLSSNLSGTTK